MTQEHIETIKSMAHSALGNYIVPGLTSSLISGGVFGKVRLFDSSREQHEHIAPHSHRFDFTCLVLQGEVEQRIFERVGSPHRDCDDYMCSVLEFRSSPGDYIKLQTERASYTSESSVYSEGQWYSMKSHEIHSIRFGRDTVVLFFEGPTKNSSSVVLEPVVAGQVIPTFKTEPWMFQPQEETKP